MDHQKLHIVNKPYKCQYCNKTFNTKSTRKYHERFHTGEKNSNVNIVKNRSLTNVTARNMKGFTQVKSDTNVDIVIKLLHILIAV